MLVNSKMMSSILEYCSKEICKDHNKKLLREKIVKPAIEIILSELKDYIIIFGAIFAIVICILICILILLIVGKNT